MKALWLGVFTLGLLPVGAGTPRSIVAGQRTELRKQTFIGLVTRNPAQDPKDHISRYVMYDETRKKNYYLDDRGKAAKFNDKKAKIEGTLDSTNRTIHVDSITSPD